MLNGQNYCAHAAVFFCFFQGDLKHILRQRDNEADLHLQYHHQLSILLQLCDAMQYLSARRFVHRDVAAHSCIVNSAFQVCAHHFPFTYFSPIP